MRVNKYVLGFVIGGIIAICLSEAYDAVYASEPQSLSDILSADYVQPDNKSYTINTTTPFMEETEGVNSTNLFMNIMDSTDMTEVDSEIVTETGNWLARYAGIGVQIASYLITIGMTLRIVLDLVYIVLPFMRGIMMPKGGSTSTSTSMNSGSIGTGIGGIGGIGATGGSLTQTTTSNKGTGMTLVSNTALNAVQHEANIATALKLYAKDMVALFIIVPILLVLATTGVLTQLGFFVGNIVGNIISGIAH